MKYFAFIKENLVTGIGQCPCLSDNMICLEISEEQYSLIEEKGNNYYIYQNGELVLNSEYDEIKLAEAKEKKQQENIDACNAKRYNQSFTLELQEDKLCEFDTSEQTQRDLLTAGGVTSRSLVYQGWICNNGTEIDLTEEDIQAIFQQFFMMVSPLYAIEKQYAEAIDACTTVEEVEAIELNYEINEDIEPEAVEEFIDE